jgi:hypothetical protein
MQALAPDSPARLVDDIERMAGIVAHAQATRDAAAKARPLVIPPMPAQPDGREVSRLAGQLSLVAAAEAGIEDWRKEREAARVNLAEREKAMADFGGVPVVEAADVRAAERACELQDDLELKCSVEALEAEKEVTRLTERLRLADEQAALVPALRADKDAADDSVLTWRTVAEACGPAGVRQLMIDQGLTALEAGANRWLGLLSYADLSGAQSVAVGLAVRLSLAELGGGVHGVRHETVILDEADSWLVGDKQDAYLRLLRTLADSGYDVLCISHISSVKEQVDQLIELIGTAQGTEVRAA